LGKAKSRWVLAPDKAPISLKLLDARVFQRVSHRGVECDHANPLLKGLVDEALQLL